MKKINAEDINVNKIFRTTDRLINYHDYEAIYKELSNIESIKDFCKSVSKYENDRNFMDGIIEVKDRAKEEKWALSFIYKYHVYLSDKIDMDYREYINNPYCLYRYLEDLDNPKKRYLDGKLIIEIDFLLSKKYDSLIRKVYNGEKIDERDKDFIEQTFLCNAYYGVISKYDDGMKGMMFDVVSYFKKYPIDDFKDPKKRQLFFLNELSKRILEVKPNCSIQFSFDKVKNCLGSFSFSEEDDDPIIKINALDIYDIESKKDFVKKHFTILHEFGHFLMKFVKYPSFSDSEKRIVDMEETIIEEDDEFYSKYHDSFFLEKFADFYALDELDKCYNDKNKFLTRDEGFRRLVLAVMNFERIGTERFFEMEIEKYNSIVNRRRRG